VQVLSIESPFPCFAQRDQKAIIEKLRGRFRADLSVKDFVQHCLDLIISSYGHYGTRQYDSFQYYTNGIEI
jgi:phosphatidylinositol kinase/protein kinase (PI-3  family)